MEEPDFASMLDPASLPASAGTEFLPLAKVSTRSFGKSVIVVRSSERMCKSVSTMKLSLPGRHIGESLTVIIANA